MLPGGGTGDAGGAGTAPSPQHVFSCTTLPAPGPLLCLSFPLRRRRCQLGLRAATILVTHSRCHRGNWGGGGAPALSRLTQGRAEELAGPGLAGNLFFFQFHKTFPFLAAPGGVGREATWLQHCWLRGTSWGWGTSSWPFPPTQCCFPGPYGHRASVSPFPSLGAGWVALGWRLSRRLLHPEGNGGTWGNGGVGRAEHVGTSAGRQRAASGAPPPHSPPQLPPGFVPGAPLPHPCTLHPALPRSGRTERGWGGAGGEGARGETGGRVGLGAHAAPTGAPHPQDAGLMGRELKTPPSPSVLGRPPPKPQPTWASLGFPAVLPPRGGLRKLAPAQAVLAPEPRAAKRAAFLPAVFQSNWQVRCLPRPPVTRGSRLGELPAAARSPAPPAPASPPAPARRRGRAPAPLGGCRSLGGPGGGWQGWGVQGSKEVAGCFGVAAGCFGALAVARTGLGRALGAVVIQAAASRADPARR